MFTCLTLLDARAVEDCEYFREHLHGEVDCFDEKDCTELTTREEDAGQQQYFRRHLGANWQGRMTALSNCWD